MALSAKDLPYTASAASRLQHYARFALMTAEQKTHWLIELARLDPFYARVVKILEDYGYHIQHRFYGHSGAYLPENIEIIEECETELAVQALHAQGDLKAKFAFSFRFGGAQIAHYWLHELMHFWQDLHGLFLTPLQQKGAIPVMLDAPSHVAVTCFCEAMAETEALRASWRLKEKGFPVAWQGALSSQDWGQHARFYAKNMQQMSEVEAARHSFDRWYESGKRSYYEKRALKAYQKTLNGLSVMNPEKVKIRLRQVNLDELLKTLPEAESPEYLNLPGYKSLDDAQLYTTAHHKRTAKQAHALHAQYGTPKNPNFQDIRTGAAPYIWKWSTDEITTHVD